MKYVSYALFGLACAVGGFAAKTGLENEKIAQFFRDHGSWIIVTAVAGLLLLGATLGLGYVYARSRLQKLLKVDTPLTEMQIAEGVVDILSSPEGITNPTPQDRRRAAVVNAATWLMRRQASQFYFNVTVTVMGGLIGTATLILLYEQNLKIELQTAKVEEQNRRLTLQTDANIVQSVLLEGARRTSFAGEMTALLTDIRTVIAAKDIRNDQNWCSVERPVVDCWVITPSENGPLFHLSDDLTSRISAFIQRSTPYRLAVSGDQPLDFEKKISEQFRFPNLSPERGALFETLVLNRVYTPDFDFSYASLGGTDLSESSMFNARLPDANLEDANLSGAKMKSAWLMGARLNRANLFGANLTEAILTRAKLGQSDLRAANLTNANLTGANLASATLGATNLTGANLSGADISGTILATKSIFYDVWAWADLPPKGWPQNIVITLCEFDPKLHVREFRPDAC